MDEMPTDGFRHRPLWFVAVAAVLVAQAGLALSLFGVGALLSLFTGRGALHSGLRMLLLGGFAGAVTFAVGRLAGVALG